MKTAALCLEEIVACSEMVNFRCIIVTGLPQRLLLLYELLSPQCLDIIPLHANVKI